MARVGVKYIGSNTNTNIPDAFLSNTNTNTCRSGMSNTNTNTPDAFLSNTNTNTNTCRSGMSNTNTVHQIQIHVFVSHCKLKTNKSSN